MCGLISSCLALALGGSNVEVELPVKTANYYVSLDLIILDILFMSLFFVPFERIFKRTDQRILRSGIKMDLCHYGLNHLLMGGLLVLISIPGLILRDLLPDFGVGESLGRLPLLFQALVILFVADFTQYWSTDPFILSLLYGSFKIHHSTTKMDWLAGSRLHIFDVLVTRSISTFL